MKSGELRKAAAYLQDCAKELREDASGMRNFEDGVPGLELAHHLEMSAMFMKDQAKPVSTY